MPANDVSRIVELDVVEVQLVTRKVHDHAADRDVLLQPELRQIAAQEVRAARYVIERELGAVREVPVALVVPDVSGIVKQRRDYRHLCACRTELVGRFDAALITCDKPRQRQCHIERVLHVVIGRIAAQVARIAAGEQALKIVESKPELVERRAGKRSGKKFVHGLSHRGRVTDLHGVGNVVIVAAILRHSVVRLFF